MKKDVFLKVSCELCERLKYCWEPKIAVCSFTKKPCEQGQDPCEHWIPVIQDLKSKLFNQKWRM